MIMRRGRRVVAHADGRDGSGDELQKRQQHWVLGCAITMLLYAVNEDQRAVNHGQFVGLCGDSVRRAAKGNI